MVSWLSAKRRREEMALNGGVWRRRQNAIEAASAGPYYPNVKIR
jgi:hypothetical protein